MPRSTLDVICFRTVLIRVCTHVYVYVCLCAFFVRICTNIYVCMCAFFRLGTCCALYLRKQCRYRFAWIMRDTFTYDLSTVASLNRSLCLCSADACMLLDCGPGTWGQMCRFYGKVEAKHMLRRLRGIFVSHLHIDHHMVRAKCSMYL